ncbi:MAG TPA: helix-turn-helix domain-containing protein [Pseudonocardia sp.]
MINDWAPVRFGHRDDAERELAAAIAERNRQQRRRRSPTGGQREGHDHGSGPVLAPLWTVQDVSDFLRVPVQTLYAWRSRRVGPPARRLGKHLRYLPADVEAWVSSQGDGD